jgi:hypothetical protein
LQPTGIKIDRADKDITFLIKLWENGGEIDYSQLMKAEIFFVSKLPRRIYRGELIINDGMLRYSPKSDDFNVGSVVAGVRLQMIGINGYITRFFSFVVNEGKAAVQPDTLEAHMETLIEAKAFLRNVIVTADDNIELYLDEINVLIGGNENGCCVDRLSDFVTFNQLKDRLAFSESFDPVLQNEWQNHAGTWNVMYTKDAVGDVMISGIATKSNAVVSDEAIFALPFGFRPQRRIQVGTLARINNNIQTVIPINIFDGGQVCVGFLQGLPSISVVNTMSLYIKFKAR